MFEISSSRKIILALVALGLGLMLVVSLQQRLTGPGLVVHNQTVGGGNTGAQSKADALTAEIGQHMAELKENPNDFGGLVHLSELLMQAEQWEAAENFLRRAISLDATKAQPHYLLAIILHNGKKYKEAADSLEKSLAINDDPSARWSLGVLYAYYLDDVAKGLDELQKALKSPKITPELKANVETEIRKIQEAIQEAQQTSQKK